MVDTILAGVFGTALMGVVVPGVPGALLKIGDLGAARTLLAIAGFCLMAFLPMRRTKGGILIDILVITAVSFVLGLAPRAS